MTLHKLVLASSSSTRKQLLARLGIPFSVAHPNTDETPLVHETPRALAERLAKEKAHAIAKHYPDHLVIGADQVIMCGNVRLDKPGTVAEAVRQLSLVSGKSIDSYTGLCLLNTQTLHYQTGIETCKVGFRELTLPMIERYIAADQPLHCAGSIKAESLGITLFTYQESRDPTALLGLPLILLTDMLGQESIAVP